MAQQAVIRQNYHSECEAGVNKQINLELYASYVYMSMAYYFERDDVALPGFSKFFKKCSNEEREHAQILMKFQNSRGGRVVLQNIQVAFPIISYHSFFHSIFRSFIRDSKIINQVQLAL